MFAQQYNLYQYMDKHDLLDNDNAFDIYQDLYKSMYGNNEDDHDEDNNDDIENMLDVVNNNKFESSDKILKKLDMMESMIDDSDNSSNYVNSYSSSEISISSSELTEVMLNDTSVYSTDSEEENVSTTI